MTTAAESGLAPFARAAVVDASSYWQNSFQSRLFKHEILKHKRPTRQYQIVHHYAVSEDWDRTGGLKIGRAMFKPQHVVVFAAPTPPDLDEALADLKGAADEAREEGFEPPDDLALHNARRLLNRMYELRPCRYEVYPTEEREVAIYVPQGDRSVLVTCAPDGSVRCSTSVERKRSRAYYGPAHVSDPPAGFQDGFLRDALAALDAE